MGNVFIILQDRLLESSNWNAIFQQNSMKNDALSILSKFQQDPSKFTSLRATTDFKVQRGFDGTHIEELSFPNRTWSIRNIDADQGIFIEHNGTGEQIFIANEFLNRSFRKPQLYERTFYISPNEYILVIPPNVALPLGITRYIELMTKNLSNRRAREKKEGSVR